MSDVFDEVPETQCPRCRAWIPDYDGFGVLAHVAPMPGACGYCRHPSRNGDGAGNWVCGICGDMERAEQP